MKKRVFLTIMVFLMVGAINFILHQVIVPEVGTNLAVLQVTENLTGAGVRAVDRSSEYIDLICFIVFIGLNLLIWNNTITNLIDNCSKKGQSCKCKDNNCK